MSLSLWQPEMQCWQPNFIIDKKLRYNHFKAFSVCYNRSFKSLLIQNFIRDQSSVYVISKNALYLRYITTGIDSIYFFYYRFFSFFLSVIFSREDFIKPCIIVQLCLKCYICTFCSYKRENNMHIMHIQFATCFSLNAFRVKELQMHGLKYILRYKFNTMHQNYTMNIKYL